MLRLSSTPLSDPGEIIGLMNANSRTVEMMRLLELLTANGPLYLIEDEPGEAVEMPAQIRLKEAA